MTAPARHALAAAVAALAALPAACGGDDEPTVTRIADGNTTEPAETSTDTAGGREPSADRTAPEPVGDVYTCRGEELRTLPSERPVEVEPEVVEPGDGFSVTIAEPSARVAIVSLTGVTTEPIVVRAQPADEGLVAALTMPESADCGNKLLTVEGDVSAEASVAVRR